MRREHETYDLHNRAQSNKGKLLHVSQNRARALAQCHFLEHAGALRAIGQFNLFCFINFAPLSHLFLNSFSIPQPTRAPRPRAQQ
jgi:hypothetical protein